MFSKTKFAVILLIVLMVGSITFVAAQATEKGETSEQKRGWAARIAQAKQRQQAGRENRDDERARTAEQQRQTEERTTTEDDSEAQNELSGWEPLRQRPEPLVGTWLIDISESDAGFPPFRALHTFHDGGTFTEVSNLLAKLGETPAHGAWTGSGSRYNLTFELFAFDPATKDPVGIVRVRVAIRLLSRNELVGDTAVDFIAPDGTVERGIDGGPFTGKRIKVLPVR